tara:strand:- start:1460 stop:1948 length:489 start_codon:yes stop_codon:yes gene_type:complete
MNQKQGWIKIHRQLLDWEWYDDINVTRLFLHILLKANHKPKNYKGEIVKVGEHLTSRDILSKETGLTVRQVRTALTKLKMTSELTITSSSQGTKIQVVNYEKFQVVTSDMTTKRPATDQRATSNKNVKNEKKKKNKQKKEIVIPYMSTKSINNYLKQKNNDS